MDNPYYVPQQSLEQDSRDYKWFVDNGKPDPYNDSCDECGAYFTDADLESGNWDSVEYCDRHYEDDDGRVGSKWVMAHQHQDCKKSRIERETQKETD